MRAVIVYKNNASYEREVEGYLREFRYRTGKDLETMDPDARDAVDFCRVYDITEFPTIIALDDLGRVQGIWRGMPFPLIDEVSYYVQ